MWPMMPPAADAQLTGTAREQAMALFPVLFNALVEKDMSLLEVNPLIVTKSNDLQLLTPRSPRR